MSVLILLFSLLCVPTNGFCEDASAGSAINRPDFKIRNLPYAPESPRLSAAGEPLEFGDARPSAIEPPSAEEILSSVPDDLIIRYLDRTDIEKRMTASQMAAKYSGAASPGRAPAGGEEPAREQTLAWLMMSDPEQREAKLAWFKAARASISLDDFNRVVDLRNFRVMKAIQSGAIPGLRKVDVSALAVKDIERLRMPPLKPLKGWDRRPNVDVPGPTIRPVSIELPPERSEDRLFRPEPSGREDDNGKAPTVFGIPGGLRNSP